MMYAALSKIKRVPILVKHGMLPSCILDHRYYSTTNSQKHGGNTKSICVKCDMFVHLWFSPCGQTRGMRRKNRNLMMKGNTSK